MNDSTRFVLFASGFVSVIGLLVGILYAKSWWPFGATSTPPAPAPAPASRWTRFKGFLGRVASASWSFTKKLFGGWMLKLLVLVTLVVATILLWYFNSSFQEFGLRIPWYFEFYGVQILAYGFLILLGLAVLSSFWFKLNKKGKFLVFGAIALATFFLFGPTHMIARASQDIEIDQDSFIRWALVLGGIFGLIFLFKSVIMGFSPWMAGKNPRYWWKVLFTGFGLLVLVAWLLSPNSIEASKKHLNRYVYRGALEFGAWFEGWAGSANRQPTLAKLNQLRSSHDELTVSYEGVKYFRGQYLLTETRLRSCFFKNDQEICWGRYPALYLKPNPKLPSQTRESLGVSCRTVKGGAVWMKTSEDAPDDSATLIPPDTMMKEFEGDRWYKAKDQRDQEKITIIVSRSPSQECNAPAPRPLPQ